MTDIGLFVVNNCIDLKLTDDGSKLAGDDGLETAVLISLFTDMRVSESELPVGTFDKKGWWADEFSNVPGDQIGSKIWASGREGASVLAIQAIQTRAKQSLDWMIEDGVAESVSVVATRNGSNGVSLDVSILRPDDEGSNRFSLFWDGQKLKRN